MSDAFATVWRPGSGAQWVRWGMSGDEFKAQDSTYFAQGLRVTSLVIENGKIAAVWHPGSGAQWIRWGMSGDELALSFMPEHNPAHKAMATIVKSAHAERRESLNSHFGLACQDGIRGFR